MPLDWVLTQSLKPEKLRSQVTTTKESLLQLLNISNIALIDELRVEFESGLNLLTGETGSGKSIIVDALGVLIGGRFTADLLKTGKDRGSIEGLFIVEPNPEFEEILNEAGIVCSESTQVELIIRREISATGRNKIFINNQLATQSLLKQLREFLVDIHGQGDQQTLFNSDTHLQLLDSFAGNENLLNEVADAFETWSKLREELDTLIKDEAEKFQLVDTLTFQINELERAQLVVDEDQSLEEERRRLMNVEKLTTLCQSSYARIYEDDEAALARVRQTVNDLTELAEFDSSFGDYREQLDSALAVLEDLAFSLRDFADRLEYSPSRLAQIEDRLVELLRVKRKYGGSIGDALEHLARSQDRLQQIEASDEREAELRQKVEAAESRYFEVAHRLHQQRVKTAKKFEKAVEQGIKEVAMENGRFQIQVADLMSEMSDKLQLVDQSGTKISARENLSPVNDKLKLTGHSGTDHVEFYFSANVGEELKPLARVASGGEASRLMLVLKTVANATEFPRTIVFDEIDTGIGGRVSEAVGVKLKRLSSTNQVLCVTHQPQIARFADSHLVVEKQTLKERTKVIVNRLDKNGRVEEIARMLTGAEITESARKHAREMLK
ncbi:MAG: DNA repair protein RecN [Blastocatellia bacterium]|nr:MAG: DNA repair protein RecN [Blastocatellia bacterium]